jgi:hypothetical protein
MNPTPITPANPLHPGIPSAGLLRIRRISRYLKAMVLLYFVAAPLYFIGMSFYHTGNGPGDWHFAVGLSSSFSAGEKLLAVLAVSIYFAMAVTFYRLLNGFEQGIFFSPATVRFLRLLGYLAFGNGLLGVISPVILTGALTFPTIILSAVGSPWVAGGLFVIMMSHIMDEGCKMREEQDLTV